MKLEEKQENPEICGEDNRERPLKERGIRPKPEGKQRSEMNGETELST